MIGLKESFGSVSYEQWIERLKKDLKSDDLHELTKSDDIENFDFTSYTHETSVNKDLQALPHHLLLQEKNDWKNGVIIVVDDEKKANTKALDVLMKGADALHFILEKAAINWDVLLDNIGLEFIFTEFTIQTKEQFQEINNRIGKNYPSNLAVNIDLMIDANSKESVQSFISLLNGNFYPVFLVDGYSIQQCGANITEELAFCLSTGNEYLIRLIEAGLTIDEAARCLHFKLGVGAHYFQEIAKFRSFKALWAAVVNEYKPQVASSTNCMLSAQIGLMNKSLIDPYTNLLRQTTETMSATIGGVHRIFVLPYDSEAATGSSQLSERMALNISLILKEESYFDNVIDPIGGSYSIEQLTEIIIKKAWILFGELDEIGGVFNDQALNLLREAIAATALNRINRAIDKKDTLIGINKYTTSSDLSVSFKEIKIYLQIPQLILERELIPAKA